MGRPLQDIQIFGVQDRRKSARNKKPWVVRRRVDGIERSSAFTTRALADRYRSRLVVAHQDGEEFDQTTGEPTSWAPSAGDVPFHLWVREWLAGEWPEWQPRTRNSQVEALARFVPLVRPSAAPEPPEALRAYLMQALRPGFDVRQEHECERWLERWSPPLGDLNRGLLAKAEQALVTRVDSSGPLGPATASRYRKSCRTCVRRAFELEKIPADPWPPAPKGRGRRKVTRKSKPLDVRRLPGPEAMATVIAAMRSHQPGSRVYQLMSAVMYYGGLRPSEVVMLRPRALKLPESGWGRIDVTEADIDFDESGDPKEGERSVPIPPVLVALLQAWLDERNLGEADLLFRTRNGQRPTQSNWGRCLKRALKAAGLPPIPPYALRHAAATTWLRGGVPLGEVARRLGHSVETLVSTYVGVLDGDEETANQRIDAILALPGKTGEGSTAEAA